LGDAVAGFVRTVPADPAAAGDGDNRVPILADDPHMIVADESPTHVVDLFAFVGRFLVGPLKKRSDRRRVGAVGSADPPEGWHGPPERKPHAGAEPNDFRGLPDGPRVSCLTFCASAVPLGLTRQRGIV